MHNQIKNIIEIVAESALPFSDLAHHPALVAADETGNEEVKSLVADCLVEIQDKFDFLIEELGKLADSKVETIEMTPQILEEMATVASEFDVSGDEMLMKHAAVIDQLLLNFGQQGELKKFKLAEDKEVGRLQEKMRTEQGKELYTKARETLQKDMDASGASKAIENTVKQYRPLQHALSTRHCPSHPGTTLLRVADGVFQCSLDHEIYNYNEGFTTAKGDKVPPGAISDQTRSLGDRLVERMSFSTRESVALDKAHQ